MSIKNKKAKEVIRDIIGHISFGELLKSCRLAEELTQVEMAKKLKISKQELCNIEKGRKKVSIERTTKFAKRLGLSPTVFVKYIVQDGLYEAGLLVKVEIKKAA